MNERSRQLENLHHLIPQVIDHFDRNAPGLGLVKRARYIAVQCAPGIGVDFGFQRGFQGAVGVVRSQKIGVADKETFFVVIGVNEPAGNAVNIVADDFAGLGLEHIDTIDFDLELFACWHGIGVLAREGGFQVVAIHTQNVNVGFAKNHKEVAFAGVFQVFGHVQVGVHTGLEHGDASEF